MIDEEMKQKEEQVTGAVVVLFLGESTRKAL